MINEHFPTSSVSDTPDNPRFTSKPCNSNLETVNYHCQPNRFFIIKMFSIIKRSQIARFKVDQTVPRKQGKETVINTFLDTSKSLQARFDKRSLNTKRNETSTPFKRDTSILLRHDDAAKKLGWSLLDNRSRSSAFLRSLNSLQRSVAGRASFPIPLPLP